MPMNLFVVEPMGTGGMIHYAYQLCTALANEPDVRVTLVTTRDYELDAFPHNFTVEKRLKLWQMFDPHSMESPPRGKLAKIRRKIFWNIRRGLRALQLVGAWWQLTNFLLAQKPDVIQFGKINFPFEAIFLARLRRRGLKLTQICHEFELREQTGIVSAVANNMYASVYRNFRVMFFHSESNRRRFLELFEVPDAELAIIPHGNESLFPTTAEQGAVSAAELRRRYGLPDGVPVVLFFGILVPSKGVPDLLEAFALAKHHQSKAKLVVAGFPSKYISLDDYRAQANQLGIAEDVIFDGRYIPFEEVAGLMELATVVVYPYHNSTQSGSMQVAYAFGKPVIATRVGGLPDVVEEGKSGLLVSPQSPPELAAAIEKIIGSSDLAAQMGEYARHLSETQYSWQPIATKIVAAYREVLSREPEHARQADQLGGKAGQ